MQEFTVYYHDGSQESIIAFSKDEAMDKGEERNPYKDVYAAYPKEKKSRRIDPQSEYPLWV